ncbi:MAG: GP88 family protein [Bacteroidota bacterium]|jgi:hypothetical protein
MKTETMKVSKVSNSIGLKIAADLINGNTASAREIIAADPARAMNPATWEGVMAKLVRLADSLRGGTTIVQPAFSIFKEDGNSKLPFAAFSSMAILDCAGYGECGKWCYSKTAWRNPNAYGRQVANSMLLRHEVGRALIASAFAKLQSPVLRLYVDGDFYSKENLKWWMDLIKTRPSLAVYGYSKSWVEFLSLNLDSYEWPSNYILNLSGGSRHDGTMMRDLMMRLPITRGEFIAVPVAAVHIKNKSYQSKRNAGFAEYSKAVRNAAAQRVFVCAGKCGDCLPDGSHACGSDRLRGVTIAIGVH